MNSINDLKDRKHSMFTSTVSTDIDDEPYILGEKLIDLATQKSIGYIVASMFVGKKIKSQKTEDFTNLALKLLVDHGPYVSGAVNTMITARAGKDLVSSLSAGLLTIGDRFGGAINGAAQTFFKGIEEGKASKVLVEDFASRKEYIPGIGHRKYRMDLPDPRTRVLREFGLKLKSHKYLDYAIEIEKITTSKKPNLILNVDGHIAAILLDLLVEEEKLKPSTIQTLISAEFFNALFVLARSVGFISHFLDQKRLNEPLFRLEPKDVLYAGDNS